MRYPVAIMKVGKEQARDRQREGEREKALREREQERERERKKDREKERKNQREREKTSEREAVREKTRERERKRERESEREREREKERGREHYLPFPPTAKVNHEEAVQVVVQRAFAQGRVVDQPHPADAQCPLMLARLLQEQTQRHGKLQIGIPA